ncbi:MAG: hypothetical protein AB3N33_00610 [Puniceicoccaceae bacterium]
MNPLILINYFLPAALIVLSFFFSIRCLFAHDMRIEAWRSPVKQWIYIDHFTFKRFIKSLGVLLLFVFLIIANHEVMNLIQ